MKKLLLISLLFSALLACDVFSKVKVVVSIAPQKYFIDKIAGNLANTIVITPSNRNPEQYEPTIMQMGEISDAKLYFGVGIDFEREWKDRFLSSAKNLTYVQLQSDPNMMHHHHEHDGHEHHEHDHHHHDHHKHDAHVWLSVKFASIHAKQITEALIKIDPEHKSTYEKNLKAFEGEIKDLDSKIKAIFDAPSAQKTFLVYHPAFEYLSAEYGLKELSIQREGKEPTLRHLKELSDTIRQKKLQVIYLQPGFSEKQVRLIAQSNKLKISTLDPFAPNWASNMLDIAQKIASQK